MKRRPKRRTLYGWTVNGPMTKVERQALRKIRAWNKRAHAITLLQRKRRAAARRRKVSHRRAR